MFISGGNPHHTSRFCGVVLCPTTISKIVSKPLQDPLGHILSGFRYRTTHHLCPCFRFSVLSVRGCVKSPTSNKRWPDNVFISGGNPHLTSRFCGVVLGPTTISKMLLEPLRDPLGHLLSDFCYRTTHHLCPRTKPNSAGREGVC